MGVLKLRGSFDAKIEKAVIYKGDSEDFNKGIKWKINFLKVN